MANGQDTTFDAKVQYLFFNIDISNRSTFLIDEFAKIPELTYKQKKGHVVHALMGSVWTHTFTFTKQPLL